MKDKIADLHVHTNYSDGSFTPEEAVRYARDKGIDCISITDHDSVKGLDEAMSAGNAYGVEIIPGVEISAEEDGKEMHILGYYIDYKDEHLLGFLKKIREDRVKRLYKIVEALNNNGMDINAEDVLEFTGDVSISRLHIAQYMKHKNLISSWREAFTKYIGDTQPCYVASFRYSSKEVIDLIKSARGVSVIAHPALNRVDNILPRLVAEGIGGIEAFHSEQSKTANDYYIKFAKENNLVITGGSDCHGKAKGRILMGQTSIPYSYVEKLRDAR